MGSNNKPLAALENEGLVREAIARLKVSVQNVVMGGWKQAMPDLDTLLRAYAALKAELARVREASALLVGEEIARADKAEAARDAAMREMNAYARRCGELEAQLCAQLVEHPGRKAMILVMQELRRAKIKHPHFADDLAEAVYAVLGREFDELRYAVRNGDIHGEHGVIREAAQVGAVALRIIEMAQGMGEVADA